MNSDRRQRVARPLDHRVRPGVAYGASELEKMSDPASTFRGPETLSLVVEETGSRLLLRLAGGLDLTTIGSLMAALDRVDVDRTSRIVLDLQEVDFLDAAGLHTLLRANANCKDHDVQMTVIKPRGLARRVFTLTRVHRELDLVDSPAAADPEASRPPQKAWLRRLGLGGGPRTKPNGNRPRPPRSGMTSPGRLQSP